jgi:uridine kinase
MIGDKIVAKPYHVKAAKEIFAALKDAVSRGRSTITIAGESGSGKSEIASELAKCFEAAGKKTYVFQQDDYFFYPPKSNHAMREKSITHVGTGEVNLELLDEHLDAFKHPNNKKINKPLVIFEEDRITDEDVDINAYDIAIAEGTYTTSLKNADHRIFIDRTYQDTLEDRKARGRDVIDSFTNRILQIEHEIISKHKELATIIVENNYSVTVLRK